MKAILTAYFGTNFYEKGLLVGIDEFDKQAIEERLEELNNDFF